MSYRSSMTRASVIAQSQVSDSFLPREQQVQNGGLFTKQQCKSIAKSIIQTYDSNGDGICQTMQVAKWLVDCYRAMNKTFQPTATDIASYIQVVDKSGKGKISIEDLQNFIVRYFYNANRRD